MARTSRGARKTGERSSLVASLGADRLVSQPVPVDLPAAQSFWAVPDVEQARGVRTDKHGEPLLAGVPSADRSGVSAAVIAAVMTQSAEGPAGGRVVGAEGHTDRPICRFSQSDSQVIALRPALSTTRVL